LRVKLLEKLRQLRIGPISAADYINKGVLRNIIYLTFAIILFFFGVLVYGIILNLRNVPLSEAMIKNGFNEIVDPKIVVDRRNYTLGLYEDSVLIKTYRVSFGKSIHTPKSRAGDRATPVGTYKICKIDTAHKYHKFFQINYPNLDDAANALRKGWISQKEYNDIHIRGLFVEPSFFSVFNFGLKYGNPETALNDPYSIIISEETAIKFFNRESIKTIRKLALLGASSAILLLPWLPGTPPAQPPIAGRTPKRPSPPPRPGSGPSRRRAVAGAATAHPRPCRSRR